MNEFVHNETAMMTFKEMETSDEMEFYNTYIIMFWTIQIQVILHH